MKFMNNDNTELFSGAIKFIEKAYSPYSDIKIGASILAFNSDKNKHKIFSGANVENASYGASICAERTAIIKAINENFRIIKKLALVTSSTKIETVYPCGICLQFLSEFADDECKIYLAEDVLFKNYKTFTFSSLLPGRFKIN